MIDLQFDTHASQDPDGVYWGYLTLIVEEASDQFINVRKNITS